MASAKLATLIIRTLAKPISSRIKEQVQQHETFRTLCVDLAQFMYRSEVKLRTNILGEPARLIRPLSEAKAIDSGANALAEGFLFTVAAGLIIGETWRSSRNSSKRRDSVDDQLEDLGARIADLGTRVDALARRWEEREEEGGVDRMRTDELARILERVVEIGLRGGWAEFQESNNSNSNAPVQLPLPLSLSVPRGAGFDSNSNNPNSDLDSSTNTNTKVQDSSLAAVARAAEDAEGRARGRGRGSLGEGVGSTSGLSEPESDPTTTTTATPSSQTKTTPKPSGSS